MSKFFVDPLRDAFLRWVPRWTTERVGRELWELLADKPDGAIVNATDLARKTSLSRETIHRSLRWFVRTGRVCVEEDYRPERRRSGRPRRYRLGVAFTRSEAGDRESCQRERRAEALDAKLAKLLSEAASAEARIKAVLADW